MALSRAAAESNKRYDRNVYMLRTLKIRKDSGIMEAVEEATQKLGASKNGYMIDAVAEKLARDGIAIVRRPAADDDDAPTDDAHEASRVG